MMNFNDTACETTVCDNTACDIIFAFLKHLEHAKLRSKPGSPIPPASSLNEFRIIKTIFQSRLSILYLAIHKETSLQVVLKVYRNPPYMILHMLKREIDIQIGIDHPNILQMYCAFLEYNTFVLVLEYARHGSLLNLRLRQPQHTFHDNIVKHIAVQVLNGIICLHENNILHRDIKPDNILICDNGKLKIADFGSAIDISLEHPVTNTGTINFMAPEVSRCPIKTHAEDNKDREDLYYSAKCDIWSLGALIYECIMGYPPGKHFSHIAIPNDLSPSLRNFLEATLHPDPNKRPTSLDLSTHF